MIGSHKLIIAGINIPFITRKREESFSFFFLYFFFIKKKRKKIVRPKDRKGRTCPFVGRTLFHQKRGEKGACVFIFSYENI